VTRSCSSIVVFEILPPHLLFVVDAQGYLAKIRESPKLVIKKSAHQARFHSSPKNRSPNAVLKLAKFGSSELIRIHPNRQIRLFGSPE
jgi:hypothetical protein